MLTITFQDGPFQATARVESQEQAREAARVFSAFKAEYWSGAGPEVKEGLRNLTKEARAEIEAVTRAKDWRFQ